MGAGFSIHSIDVAACEADQSIRLIPFENRFQLST
jgi:hypothetical protein